MNISKKSKFVTLLTVAIMCVAIVTTACLVFVPNIYKDPDTDVSTADINPHATYENGGYGMAPTVTFDKNNMALALAKKDNNDHMWIYFPSKIYMDVTENLGDLGYFYEYYLHYGTSNDSDYHQVAFHSAMGLYPESGTNWQGISGKNNNKAQATKDANANMRKFFNNYDVVPSVPNGAKKNLNPSSNWNWKQSDGDSQDYYVSAMEGGVYDSQGLVKIRADMKGTGIKGSYNFKRYTASPIFLTQFYKWPNTNYQWTLTSTVSASEAASYGTKPSVAKDVPYLDDVMIKIEIYDKSLLLSSMQTMDKKYNEVKNRMSANECSRFENFRDKEVVPLLKERETTQTAINAMVNKVNSYVFVLDAQAPSDTGTQSYPISKDYKGSAYTAQDLWKGFYFNYFNSYGDSLSSYFEVPTIKYGLNSFLAGENPDGTSMINAGYYQVVFKPLATVGTFHSNNAGNINVRFVWEGLEYDHTAWENNGELVLPTPSEVTIWFKIEKAAMSVSAGSYERTFMGDTPVTITGLNNPTYTMVAKDKNPPSVLLSVGKRAENANAWIDQGLTDSVELTGVGTRKVYYRVEAANHNDAYGSFDVLIKPADISVKLNSISKVYGEDLLTSDEIFAQMLAADTPNILDAQDYAKTLDYLKKILTFQVLKLEGGAFGAAEKPNAGHYTVNAVKTSDWADKINNITFVDGTNSNAYVVTAKSITVDWTDNDNKWYDGKRGHRPSAAVSEESLLNDILEGDTVDLSVVSILGNGKALDSDEEVPLKDSNAVYAGRYTAHISSQNANYAIDNDDYTFSILQRKVSVTIVDKERQYAIIGTANDTEADYRLLLQNNTNNGAYIATLDSEIADKTSNTSAFNEDSFLDVFKVVIDATRTEDNKYFAVGTHTLRLEFNTDNTLYKNYLLVDKTDGVYTVTPAPLQVDMGQVAPKRYTGDSQDIEIPKTVETMRGISGYEKEHLEESIVIKYSSNENGPFTEEPIKIKDVVESPRRVYYEVEAPNHTASRGSFTQSMRAASITVTVAGQTEKVVYGTPIPDSQGIKDICGIDFLVEGRAVDETLDRAIDPHTIFEFYVLNPETSGAFATGIKNVNAGSYTVTHRLASNVSEDPLNFHVVYHIADDTQDRENVEAYTISKRDLHVNWEQNGDGWQGDGKDHYIFSNSTPTVFPKAVEEDVVEGDEIHLEAIEIGYTVNDSGYEVGTNLTTWRNQNNYQIVESTRTHIFYVDPLEVHIVFKDQEAEFGQANNVAIGTAFIDPMNAGALWDYAEGYTARFYEDHYSNYITYCDGDLVDVKEGGYNIGWLPNPDPNMDGTIRKNYKIIVEKEEGKNAKFYIIPAEIRFTGREFNIDVDETSGETKYITLKDLEARIDTKVDGVGLDEFNIRMSNKFYQRDLANYPSDSDQLTWYIDASAQVGYDGAIGRYYVWFEVIHKKGNYKPFLEKVELNLLTDWISVTVGELGVKKTFEYGDEVNKAEIFDNLDFQRISGFLSNNGVDLWDEEGGQQAAIEKLGQYIEFYVGSGNLNGEMKENGNVGNYTIFMRVVEGAPKDIEHNFRFARRGDATDTSNIDAYHVGPKTVTVVWGKLDEVYGSHGNSHTAYELDGIWPKDKDKVTLILSHSTDDTVENNNASFYGGHAHTAGTYKVHADSLTNSNYKLSEVNRTETFVIEPMLIKLDLHDRDFIYGVPNTHVDAIGQALNVYSSDPHYDIVDRDQFVGNDKRIDIFEISYKSSKAIPKNLTYLPASGGEEGYTYSIVAELADTETAKNYTIDVVREGVLTINPANAGCNINKLATMYFNAREQEVTFDSKWVDLSGDVDIIRNQLKIEYKIMSRDDWRAPEPSYVDGDSFTVKDAGRYKIKVRITALNHNVFETGEIDLDLTPASVVIKMDAVSKVYGDKLADFTLSSLSDWIKSKCNISITSYRYYEGNRIEEDITRYALNDFEFYVIDPNGQGENPELSIGSYQNNVGKYRIYHKITGNVNALDSNYVPEYYQAPGALSKCNAQAYEITQRPVDVKWLIDDTDKNWESDNAYYYTGSRPTLSASFTTVNNEKVVLDIEGNGADEHYAANAEGESYSAQVRANSWNGNAYSHNYKLVNDTREYRILQRPITVAIRNQVAGDYGKVNGSFNITQGEIDLTDGVFDQTIQSLPNNPITLYVEGIKVNDDNMILAGDYKIFARCNDNNYVLNCTSADGSEDHGTLTVNKGTIGLSLPATHTGIKYLGQEDTIDIKQIIKDKYLSSVAFAESDYIKVWDSATLKFETEEGSGEYTSELPTFSKAGTLKISFIINVDNYNPASRVFTVEVAKANAYLSFFNGATSVYGDEIYADSDALSKRIFEQANIGLSNKSDKIVTPIDELVKFFVVGNPTNAGSYSIGYEFIDAAQANNFELHEDEFNGTDNKYVITPKVVEVKWTLDENDDYVYNFRQHIVTPQIVGVLGDDEIDPAYSSVTGRDAGTYTAKLTGIGTNGNYAMPSEELRKFEWTISPRPIEVTWTVGEYVYDASSHAPTATYKSGLIEGDTYGQLRVGGTAVNAGTHTAVATTTNRNYTVSNSEQEFVIAPRAIHIVWGETSFEYNGENHVPTAHVIKKELLSDTDCEVVVSGAQKNAGRYTATVNSLTDSNYTVVEGVSVEFVIEPKKVNIHWSNTEFDYTGEEITPDANIEGIVKGDKVGLVISGGQINASDSAYKATATGLDNPNYVISDSSVKSVEYTINKSRNEFVEMPAIGSEVKSLPWTGENKPTSKFGEVTVKYYTDAKCTKEYKGDISKAKEGSYWVKAYVEGSANYDALESKVFAINLEKGYSKAAVATLISLSAVMLIAVLAVVLIIGKKKQKGGNV